MFVLWDMRRVLMDVTNIARNVMPLQYRQERWNKMLRTLSEITLPYALFWTMLLLMLCGGLYAMKKSKDIFIIIFMVGMLVSIIAILYMSHASHAL